MKLSVIVFFTKLEDNCIYMHYHVRNIIIYMYILQGK